jgi:16S rRNA (uracil1498-N3)-methyltransferase
MADNDKIHARLYVTDALPAAQVTLDDSRAHYLRNVLRLARGDVIAVFNGIDGEYAAAIAEIGKRGATLDVGAQRRAMAPEPDLWLVFAPLKRARIDYLVEKATELGVSAFQPVFTRHTVAERVNVGRLASIAIEAAEQSERLTVPTVHEPAKLEDLVTRWKATSAGEMRSAILADESGAGGPIADVLAKRGTDGRHAIFIGPEGGFARDELDLLRKHPFVTPVGLGPRILRADTAALAAIAVFQALAHDRLGSPPPRFVPHA